MSIVIAGATGAIGRELVIKCCSDASISRVVVLSRKEIAATEWPTVFPSIDVDQAKQKLSSVSVDWEKLTLDPTGAQWKAVFGDFQWAAMCMGTTAKDAGSAEKFRRCDLEYVSAFAAAVKKFSPGLTHFSQVSSSGACSSSWFLYLKTKGQADDATIACKFPRTSIWRPGLLGRKEKARSNETIFAWFTTAIPVEIVAEAILRDFNLNAATPGAGQVSYISNGEIYAMCKPHKAS